MWCTLAGTDLPSNEPIVHESGSGPLSASGSGGVSIYAPRRVPWTGTFGALLLCSSEPGSRIEIKAIRTSASPAPISTTHLLRSVPVEAERTGPKDLEWNPIYSVKGTYPHYTDGTVLGGTVTSDIQTTVTQPCDGPDGTSHKFTELLTEIRVNREGGAVRATLIDYTVGDQWYTLKIPWQMIACGTAVPEHCE